MVFVKAGPAEILRSSQKDEFVIGKLQKFLEETYLKVAGPRRFIMDKSIIQSAGQLIYFGCTTLSGLQTLGEEYTGILQVDERFASIPSLFDRIIMVVLHCFGYRLAEIFLATLEKNIKANQEMRVEVKTQLLKGIVLMKEFLPSVDLLHKAIFYCNWEVYHLSKRFTNIHYVLIRYWLRDRKSLFGFRLLGGITLANFILFSIQTLHDFWKRGNDFSPVEEELDPITMFGCESSKNCIMCLSPLKNPTATICGHIFCWSCINNWVQTEEKCPSCRETVHQNRLIPLMNYI